MSFPVINTSTPVGSQRPMVLDDEIRQLKTDVIDIVSQISGFPDLVALVMPIWTTATRPTAGLKNGICGINSDTGVIEKYNEDTSSWNELNANVATSATTANKLSTVRKISLTGDVSCDINFDGSVDASGIATVADDSHNHTTSTLPESVLTSILSSLNAGNGYIKLNNGLLIQWGSANGGSDIAFNTQYTTVPAVFVTRAVTKVNGYEAASSVTISGFHLYCGHYNANLDTDLCYWISIGYSAV